MTPEAKRLELADEMAFALGHFFADMNGRPFDEEVFALRNGPAVNKLALIYERYLAARPADAKWSEVA